MSKIMYKDKQILGCISDAKYAAYDNTGTGLSATNAQDAITELNGKLTIALPSESSIRSLDNKIRITEYKGRLVIQLSIDQSKDWYAMLSFDQTGLSYIKNDSDGYVSKKIV